MRAIDQKGKIFGKLNVIDLIVILLIIVVLALVGYKLVFSNGAMSGGGQKIVYTVKVEGVEPEVYEFIQESLPSQLMSSNEMLDEAYARFHKVKELTAELAEIENDTYQMVWNSNTGSQELQRVSSGTYDLVFTIEGTIQNTVSSELGSQEIRVGKSHIVKTDLFELEHGVITSCERTSLGSGE